MKDSHLHQLAIERAADEIAETLIDGNTIKVFGKHGVITLEPADVRDYLDISKLLAANKMAATGSHARAVMLMSSAIEIAGSECGKAFASGRVEYLDWRNSQVAAADRHAMRMGA